MMGSGERGLEERAIEAILMVAVEPVAPHMLAELLEVSAERVEELCENLADSYRNESRGFELVKVAGGYRIQSSPEMSEFVERFALEGHSARLSGAALETLAIIAYKQPITRGQISEIRGVNVESTVAMLQARGYVCEVGRHPGIGHAVLYGTTPLFLEKMGLASIDDLPPLADFVPEPAVVEKLEVGLRPQGDISQNE
jgi:segregation and condensation protein B